jgi:hypothetical protein
MLHHHSGRHDLLVVLVVEALVADEAAWEAAAVLEGTEQLVRVRSRRRVESRRELAGGGGVKVLKSKSGRRVAPDNVVASSLGLRTKLVKMRNG